jgi:hypothetical protein
MLSGVIVIELRIGGEHVAVNLVMQPAEQNVALPYAGDQLALRRYPAGIRINFDGRDLAQPLERAVGDRLSDENARAHQSMIPKKPALDLIRGGCRFSEKIMLRP